MQRVGMGPSFRDGTENWEAAKGWPLGKPEAFQTHPPMSPSSPCSPHPSSKPSPRKRMASNWLEMAQWVVERV